MEDQQQLIAKRKRLYNDLNQNKYQFLPFIIETTGGLNKAAYDFCEDIKSRLESLNCKSGIDCPYANDRNPSQLAINVEPQRANSRMILERTPLLENLIESDFSEV